MSEEDTELRDLVGQTLEENGVLNKIRAELRANVFLALEEQDAVHQVNISNRVLTEFLETKDGHRAFSIVQEFLHFFDLDFTLAVLEPESNCVGKFSSRENLKNELNLVKCDAKQPLLMEFIKKKIDASPASPTSPSSPKKSSSKIPQRVKSTDDKKMKTPEKRTLVSPDDLDNEDELLNELGVSPFSFSGNKKGAKPSWLSAEPLHITSENSPEKASKLGSLKDAPPLPGVTGFTASLNDSGHEKTSPEWADLLKIDEKISELGFEIPKDDDDDDGPNKEKGSKEGGYSYDDDYFLSLEKSDDKLSITEEIEGELSIGSFVGSKGDEMLTTEDETVSQMSLNEFDYGEDVEL